MIAAVVGVLLTAVNQGAVIIGGDATSATYVRSALNFLVPFCVSNLGLLGARRSTGSPDAPAVRTGSPEGAGSRGEPSGDPGPRSVRRAREGG